MRVTKNMNNEKLDQYLNKKVLLALSIVFVGILCVYFVAKASNEIKFGGRVGVAPNTISFDGMGEISAIPDIATISFTVRKDAPVVADAQTFVSTKISATLKMLKANGIADKDIKTDSYISNPKYDYEVQMGAPTSMPCSQDYCPPFVRKQTISGYEVSQTIEVKIRDTAKVGAIEKGLADLGITESYGPNFTVDNADLLKDQARAKAIANAKKKATELERELHIHLGRIVNFSENNYGGGPIMYAKGMEADTVGTPPVPNLPTGENKITSNVIITYEIR